MNNMPERDDFPTFQSWWEDGNGSAQHNLDTKKTRSIAHLDGKSSSSSSNRSTSSQGGNKDGNDSSIIDADATKPTSRYSLFSSGLSARNLWSVSSSDLNNDTTAEAWECEECGHENFSDNHGECELCGTGICFMDERKNALTTSISGRHVFVEEYGDDISPIKAMSSSSPPTTPPSKTSPTSSSLRELLSRHPSFQHIRPKRRPNDGDHLLISWGSAKTTPTANLSPVSLSPPSRSPSSRMSPPPPPPSIGGMGTVAKIRVVDSADDHASKDEEEDVTSFGDVKRDGVEKSPGKIRHELPTGVCLSPPLLLMLVALGIMTALWWIPSMHNREPVVTEGDDDGMDISDFTEGYWVQQGEEIFGDEPEYEMGASVSVGRRGTVDGGTVVAVGVGNFGPVRAWHHNRHVGWVQMGQDLAWFDVGPKHVALSRRDGETIAVASESDGSVEVFAFDDEQNSWETLGEQLAFGVTNREDARASVALSDTGRVLAVLVPAEGNVRSDIVRVLSFDADAGEWETVGEDVSLGGEARIQYGGSVSLSSNGMVLAISTWSDGLQRDTYSSHAEVYSLTNNTWKQKGQEKVGSQVSGIKSDAPVSLSSDGNFLAISGGDECRVFEYDDSKDEWSQLGQQLTGRTVSLSGDAKVSTTMETILERQMFTRTTACPRGGRRLEILFLVKTKAISLGLRSPCPKTEQKSPSALLEAAIKHKSREASQFSSFLKMDEAMMSARAN